jgi:DNA-binding response OmpR family regulator
MILVIDDSAIIHELLELILTAEGYTVLAAWDGADGLACFQAQRMQVRLIILDLQMPKVDGITTLKQLRAIDETVPIILFTAADYADASRHLPQSSSIIVLEKSCGRTVLLATIQKLICNEHVI